MTGYFMPARRLLPRRERYTYRIFYCTGCLGLLERYGKLAAFLLQSDVIWLTQFADHIAGIITKNVWRQRTRRRCPMNPFHRVSVLNPEMRLFRNAADSSAFALRLKFQDAFADGSGWFYRKIQHWIQTLSNRNRELMKTSRSDAEIRNFLTLDHRPDCSPRRRVDPVVSWLTDILTPLFVPPAHVPVFSSVVKNTLRIMYFLDALEDFPSDIRRRRPNILSELPVPPPDIPDRVGAEIRNAGDAIRRHIPGGPHETILEHILNRVLENRYSRAVDRFRKGSF